MTNDEKQPTTAYIEQLSPNDITKANTYQHLEIQSIIDIFYTLSADQKSIFLLYIQHGYDKRTIAVLLDFPYTYVKKQLNLTKKLLKNTNKQRWKEALQVELAQNYVQAYHWIRQISSYFNIAQGIAEENTRDSERRQKQASLSFLWIKWEIKIIATMLTIIIFSLSMIGANAFYSVFHHDVYENYNTVYLNLFGETTLEAIEDVYLPEYIPKGYMFSEQNGKPGQKKVMTFYSNDNKEILLRQSLKNFVFNIDTENALTKKVSIQGSDGFLILKNNLNTLVWTDENYFYFLQSNIKEKELLRIANSLKQIKQRRIEK